MIRLDEKELPNISVVGGKGYNLIKLAQSSVSVPAGFIVETSYFTQTISDVTSEADDLTVMDIKRTSERIASLQFNQELTRILGVEFEALNTEYVAVRSSAVSEDGKNASWAGQLDTELNVQARDLEKAIKKCWASAYSPRSLAYAAQNGVKVSDISVAVVVQKMVDSDVSGVAFSVNPVTADKSEIVIEAVYGLGEAIVSGEITPDEYIILKTDASVMSITVASQYKQLKRSEHRIDWISVPEHNIEVQKLGSEMLRKIASTVTEIESSMHFPVDVEWAVEAGNLYITQARPITTLAVAG